MNRNVIRVLASLSLPALFFFPLNTLAQTDCAEGETEITIEIVPDDYPGEISWTLIVDGNLIESTLIKKNTQVPLAILRFIYSHETFNSWTMTGNEIVVKDFDPYQTEYKVIMSNGDETQVLNFKEQGESIAYQN